MCWSGAGRAQVVAHPAVSCRQHSSQDEPPLERARAGEGRAARRPVKASGSFALRTSRTSRGGIRQLLLQRRRAVTAGTAASTRTAASMRHKHAALPSVGGRRRCSEKATTRAASSPFKGPRPPFWGPRWAAPDSPVSGPHDFGQQHTKSAGPADCHGATTTPPIRSSVIEREPGVTLVRAKHPACQGQGPAAWQVAGAARDARDARDDRCRPGTVCSGGSFLSTRRARPKGGRAKGGRAIRHPPPPSTESNR